MGIFDFLSEKLYKMQSPTPVFNPQGMDMMNIYDPTPEERKRALSMGLLNMGAGILANNAGHYGAFAPALGGGLQQGIQGYQSALEAGPERRMKGVQQSLYAQQVKAQTDKVRQELEDEKEAKEDGKYWLASMGVDPGNLQGSFMPVSNASVQLKESTRIPDVGDLEAKSPVLSYQDFQPEPYVAPAPSAPAIDSVLSELGYSDSQKKMFYSHAKANPQKAGEKLQRQVDDYVKAQWKGRTQARDVLARDKAIAEALGIPVGQYLRERMNKTGVNLNVSYGAPIAATDAQGNPVFIRPPKDSAGAPVVMEGYTPPEKPTEAEAKSATFHQQMSAASNEIKNIEKTLDVSRFGSQFGVKMAGGVTNPLASKEAQRYRQAQEQWAEAFLRIKTGAAATQDEVDRNIRTFFPQIGDSSEVIAQKQRQRANAERDVKAMAGTAMRRIERQPSGEKESVTIRKYNPATGRIE